MKIRRTKLPAKRYKGTLFTHSKLHRVHNDHKAYIPKNVTHKYIWVFKLGDHDDHPSVPHAHSKEEGYRLDAWTGKIYPAGNERIRVIDNLRKKELSKLHKEEGFVNFAKKQINWYHEQHPAVDFFVPEWFKLKHLQEEKTCVKGIENIPDEYIFYCK